MQFSHLALLAAAFANEALAGPVHQHRALHKRDYVIDNVIVTQEIVVTAFPDGVLKTGAPKNVGTETIVGSTVVETSVRAVSTVEPAPVVVASSSAAPKPEPTSSTLPAAVFKEQAPEPSTTTVQVSAAQPAPVVAPTTFATSVSVAPAPVVSSAAPSSSTAPAPAPSTPATTGGKRGIAYNNADYLQAFTGSSKVSWCYNWGATTSPVPSQFEFVPMLWGTGSHADNWNNFADKAIASGSKHLLGFNEPDHTEQANLSPSAAADGWRQYMEPYAGKAALGSPAVTNGGGQMGLTWLTNFYNACSGCTVDFTVVHWYNGGDAAAFKTHMQNAHAAGGNRPVWITEWQAPGSISEQESFLAEILPWIDSQDWIQRHALFMASDGLMMSGNGCLPSERLSLLKQPSRNKMS